jgi:hypothetical protein
LIFWPYLINRLNDFEIAMLQPTKIKYQNAQKIQNIVISLPSSLIVPSQMLLATFDNLKASCVSQFPQKLSDPATASTCWS